MTCKHYSNLNKNNMQNSTFKAYVSLLAITSLATVGISPFHCHSFHFE